MATQSSQNPLVLSTSSNVRSAFYNGAEMFMLRDILRTLGTSTKVTAIVKSVAKVIGYGHIIKLPFPDTDSKCSANFVSLKALVWILLSSHNATKMKSSILDQVTDILSVVTALNRFEVPDDLEDLFVYVIKEETTNKINIGISRDPEKRLKQLQTGNSNKLNLIFITQAKERFKDKKRLKDENKSYHIRGDWYKQTT